LFRGLVTDYFRILQIDPHSGEPIETNDTLAIRQTINQRLAQVEEAFNRARVLTTVFRALPLGGFQGEVNLLSNLFHLHVYQIDPLVLIDQVDRALGWLSGRRRLAWIQTLNPFYWLYRTLEAIFSLPFSLLTSAGIHGAGELERRPIVRLIKALLALAAEVVTILDLLRYLGYLKMPS
jgi:hypothetical protein